MRLIAIQTLAAFWKRHPETKPSLQRWAALVEQASWKTTSEVQINFPKAKVLSRDRVRFEVAGGDYRLIASFRFQNHLVWVKFVGTHAEYDRVDALTVSMF